MGFGSSGLFGSGVTGFSGDGSGVGVGSGVGAGFGSSGVGVTGLSGVGSGVGVGSGAGVTGFSGSGAASVSAPESPLARHVAVAETSCSLITAVFTNFLLSPVCLIDTRHVQSPSPVAGATAVISVLSAFSLFAVALVVFAQLPSFVQ